jgi:protocatechuate 3,4-dioxygenase beta subunit
VTQIFFDDEPLNGTDPLLNSIPDPVVRARLIAAYRGLSAEARLDAGERRRREYAIDIVLRGDAEAPFFDDFA